MEYRKAGIRDIDTLVRLRKQQLVDEGVEPDVDIDEELVSYFTAALGDGSLVEWVLEDGGEIVATAAIGFYQFPPTYTNKTGDKGYVTNIYTHPAYRGRGIATAMLDRLAVEARQRGVFKLWLGASQMGRPIYLKYGFQVSDDWLQMDLT